MKDSMQSISFSREEFSRGFAPGKGDSKMKDSMQSISFSREEFNSDLFELKGAVK